MPGAFLLALDQGTTSSRAVLFDEDGKVRAVAQREFAQAYPRPAWVEHDPMEIWSSQSGVVAEVLARSGVPPGEVRALGITNQRETVVVWDRRTGRPVHPAIVWQDRRTADVTERLREEGAEDLVADRTGLLLDPYFSGTKLAWILDHVDGARERANRGELAAGTIDSWLIWKLTGGRLHVTDASNASRTMLMNLETGDWDEELLRLLNVPREVLPEIRGSSEVVGECSDTSAAGIPIAGIAGDQQAALFGQACFAQGMAKSTYGTGSFVLMQTGPTRARSANRLLATVAWQVDGVIEYALEGSIFVSGAVVQWLRDGLGFFRASPMVEALAASVPDSDGVTLVPAFAGLGAPHWDPHARGLIIGLTRGTTDAHVARAALEAITFQTCDVLDAMAGDAAIPPADLRVDGGACRNNLLMQMQADHLQRPVIRPAVTETTALGAACLAGLATGFFRDRDQIAAQWRVERRFEPEMSAETAADRRERWGEAVRRSLGWASR